MSCTWEILVQSHLVFKLGVLKTKLGTVCFPYQQWAESENHFHPSTFL